MRAGLLLACLSVAGCKAIPLNDDPTWPRVQTRISHPAVYEVVWKNPLVKLGLLEYQPFEAAGPAIDPDTERVFVTTRDGYVRALSPIDGAVEWEYKTHGRFVSNPAVKNGVLYVPGGDGTLYAFRALSGEKLWEFPANEELVSSPTVKGDLVLVASQSETLFAVDKNTGKWVWQYRRDPPPGFTVRGTARPLVGDEFIYMGFADGYVTAINPESGVAMWEKRVTTTGGTQFLDVDSTPVVAGNHLVVASFKDGLASYNAKTGDLEWQAPHPNITALLGKGNVVFATGDGSLTAFELTHGQQMWSVDLSDPTNKGKGMNAGKALMSARGYLIVPTATALAFVSPTSGRVRAMWNPGRGVTATPAAISSVRYGSRLYVVSNLGTVFALNLVTSGG